jgi:hypothetical protein
VDPLGTHTRKRQPDEDDHSALGDYPIPPDDTTVA